MRFAGCVALRVVVYAGLLLTSGCATLSLAALGTVLSAVGSAASTGSSVYKLGKLDAAQMVSYDEARWAVRAAAADLHLSISLDRPDKDAPRTVWQFALCDQKCTETDVTVEQRAPTMCLYRVNVGFLGSEPIARLVMHRIHAHLPGGLAANPD